MKKQHVSSMNTYIKNIFIFVALLILSTFNLCVFGSSKYKDHNPNKQSLQQPLFYELPPGSIQANGWFENQLEVMRKGLTGNLDEEYDLLRDDNAWLGGSGYAGALTPYWLDGAVALAYLTGDKPLQEKVNNYIHWTIESQRKSGYFGPITESERKNGIEIDSSNCSDGEDWWPKILMLKVLKQYYLATNDPRVIPMLTDFFTYQHAVINQCTIGLWTQWAAAHGPDMVATILWLYDIVHEDFLLELADTITNQSFQWTDFFSSRTWVIEAAANQTREGWHYRHGVNIAAGLLDPITRFIRSGDTTYLSHLKTGWNDLMTLHGLPMGIYSADEDLHGNHPTQGVELCAVVDAMYAMEFATMYSGDILYMDALERMTYNALPAQVSDDYNLKQYYQMANQVIVQKGVYNFSLPFFRETTNVFGLKSGFTCCTANMHQGWPKFIQNMWYRSHDKGMAAFHYGPNTVTSRVGEDQTEITIEQITNYPFEEQVRFVFHTPEKVIFPFYLRIPSWCETANIYLNNELYKTYEGGQIINILREWATGDEIKLETPMEVFTSSWARNSVAIERGPLVFALKVDEKWEKGFDEDEGVYYSIYPQSPWNYGLMNTISTNTADMVEVIKHPFQDTFKWNLNESPIEIQLSAKAIPNWKAIDGVAHQPVTTRVNYYQGKVDDELTTITLIPYGFTKLRIVAFPQVQ